MTVITLDNVSASLRGECTRYMLEIKTGVFIGKLSAMVREKLWQKITEKPGTGGAIMAYSAPTEQGFIMIMHGIPGKRVIDIEGLFLIETSN